LFQNDRALLKRRVFPPLQDEFSGIVLDLHFSTTGVAYKKRSVILPVIGSSSGQANFKCSQKQVNIPTIMNA
jgi:hypothetical protein